MDVIAHLELPVSSFVKRFYPDAVSKCRICVPYGSFTKTRRWKNATSGAMAASMDERPHNQAVGSLLAASIIAGVVGGVVAGEPSIGFLVGTGAGTALALLWWLKDRKRKASPLFKGGD
jgi:hypothetical protein